MADGSGARFRMCYSFESRLRAVRLVAAETGIAEAARRPGASRSTVHRWWRRYSAEGAAGLRERSSRSITRERRVTAICTQWSNGPWLQLPHLFVRARYRTAYSRLIYDSSMTNLMYR